ncbi:hypothetical protein DL93DRAFT_2115971 [Clavulina sp. PMI_390]|nr:hypothetical protein DL93DRAFT_2115971 [Clavulina sp. PMI_390]
MANVQYHCSCTSIPSTTSSIGGSFHLAAPTPQHPAHPFAFHKLPNLYFCEECDAVRCNRCVSIEVSGYYCPNCLFEVPSASVRAEKNRCARNCFQCPHCSNTLSVVSSDPPPNPDPRQLPVVSAVGEPPFFLYCNFCRWDSAEVGITFDKPTGLALQLQKTEDSSADNLEFERLKEHFEPLVRANQAQAGPAPPVTPGPLHPNVRATPMSAINAAASSALSRDIPGLRRKAAGRESLGKASSASNDDSAAPTYKARINSAAGGVSAQSELDWIREMTQEEFVLGDVAKVEQRWGGSWAQSIRAAELRPVRIPLHSKQTKRCHKCRHILIKPEQKSQSTRFKLKLMAASYLPAIEGLVIIPNTAQGTSTIQTPRTVTKAKTAQGGAGPDDGTGAKTLQQGRTYPFHLSFRNPLYEPIQVRVMVQRPPATTTSASANTARTKRPPFAVSLPTSPFPIAPFAEAWEYDDDEDGGELDDDDIEDMLAGREHEKSSHSRSGTETAGGTSQTTVGMLERKANMTKIGGEVVIGRDGTGPVKFNLLVTYTYKADDPPEDSSLPKDRKSLAASKPSTKSFSYYVCIDLGMISSPS